MGDMLSGSQDSAGEGPAGICTVGAKIRTIKGRYLICEEDRLVRVRPSTSPQRVGEEIAQFKSPK